MKYGESLANKLYLRWKCTVCRKYPVKLFFSLRQFKHRGKLADFSRNYSSGGDKNHTQKSAWYSLAFCRNPAGFSIEHYVFPKDFPGYSKLDIFPQKLLPSAAEGEYHYQMKDTLFDPTIQMFLACTYSEEDYKKEVERIRNIQEEYRKEVKRVIYDEEHFSFPAYVTAYASNHCYEYVLFPGNQRIIYVFIQFASKDELLFDQRFLPLDYQGYGENDQENGDSIYVFVQEDGTGIGLY